ncbi:MAG: hypothetical protein IKZ59_00350 [Clostridia bacterium]|nr:hypothetical protein [Clostridia bacterium]
MTATVAKALAIVLISAVMVLSLTAQKGEFAFLVSLAAGAVVILQLINWVLPYIDTLETAFKKAGGISGYFTVSLKALAISYVTGFAADTCRDFGQSALAAKAEFAGKCAIFILCVSPAVNVLEAALRFAGI